MYNEEGETTWERSLDSNGKVKTGDNSSCPFMYQGQYYDKEIELAYNRFRYYDPEDGRYISQDPIGLLSGEGNFYAYVGNPNGWVDVFGLSTYSVSEKRKKHILDGDNPKDATDGHGPNRGKTKGAFPDTWTDDQAIASIERIANSPNSTWKQANGSGYVTAPITKGGPDVNAPSTTSKGTPVRYKVMGNDHGKTIEVIVEPGGEGVVTGYVK